MLQQDGRMPFEGHDAHASLRRTWRFSFTDHSVEQLFGLISDIESYPKFVPGCVAARVLERRPDGSWLVDNVFGAGPLRARFATRAVPEPPGRLVVTSCEPPLRHLLLDWRFVPGKDGKGCEVEITMDVAFRSALLDMLTRAGLPRMLPRLVAAFRSRAAELYAAGGSRS